MSPEKERAPGGCGAVRGPPAPPRQRARTLLDAPVAQLDRALDYGSKGWGFDSSRAHHGTKPASPSEGRSEAAARAASR